MDTILCWGVIIFCFVLIFFIFNNAEKKRNRIFEAEKDYQTSLKQLKKQPNDVDMRQATLQLGRRYASLAREGGKATLFDEVALMNDINAITGSVEKQALNQGESKTVSERLKAIEELKDNGLITQQEYLERRTAILETL